MLAASKTSSGFTLVEVMVAMVIGLLGVIVIMQVFALFEGQKRSTTGGADAQNNGAIALYGIQRDIRQSGWGFNAPNLIGCTATLPAGTSAKTLPLAPVTINPSTAIIPAGDADTDRLLVYYGNGNGASEGDIINAQLTTQQYGVATPTSFSTGDYVIAEPLTRPSPCSLTIEKATVTLPKVNVQVPTGVASVVTGSLYNLGASPRIMAYAIRSGRLMACDYFVNDCSATAGLTDASIWVPLSDNIVSLRAQYGRDTNTPIDGVVDIYDQTTPATEIAGTKNNCDWLKISSIQFVLVSRSSQPEKTLVTNTATSNTVTWRGQSASVAAALPPANVSTQIQLSSIPTSIIPTGFSWQNYRYKVFQTVVPLRNITSVLKAAATQC
ncbi:MAG: PilW family protein [Methylophilaceae bacterium]|nr:PilW family protein [Methyloradius sp.]